jgi:hypothetical protein
MEGTDVTQIRGLTDSLGTEEALDDKGYNAEQLRQYAIGPPDITP